MFKIEILGDNIHLNERRIGTLRHEEDPRLRWNREAVCCDDHVDLRIELHPRSDCTGFGCIRLLDIDFDFCPQFAFIGGMLYSAGGTFDLEREAGLSFPYSTYYKFRMRPVIQRGRLYRSAIYAKMPLACFQLEDCAVAVSFHPIVATGEEEVPLYLSCRSDGKTTNFALALMETTVMDVKENAWFGLPGRRVARRVEVREGQSVQYRVGLLVGRDWHDCVKAYVESQRDRLESLVSPSQDEILQSLRKSFRFYNRIYDSRNGTYLHLPRKNRPGFDSTEFKYSSVSCEVRKLRLFKEIFDTLGSKKFAGRALALRKRVVDGTRYEKKGDSAIWHTTTRFARDRLTAFTHHGTGFVGFPGGVSTIVRNLYGYCARTDDRDILDIARSSADWILSQQRDDGSWPTTVKVFREVRLKKVAREEPNVAASAESVRALLASYRVHGDGAYLDAAVRGLACVNAESSFFNAFGYLRDVGETERDGLTAESCINANLDMYQATGEERHLESALTWAYYALQWFYWWDTGRLPIFLAFDSLSLTVTPRIDLWGGALMGLAFRRLSEASGEQLWHRLARHAFATACAFQERDGGLCETWFLDFLDGLTSVQMEPSFVTDAHVELGLNLLEGSHPPETAVITVDDRFKPQDEFEPIRFSPAEISCSIGQVRMCLSVFPQSSRTGLQGSIYRWLRRGVFSKALYVVPALKVLLGRYRVQQPLSGVRKMKLSALSYCYRGNTQEHLYTTKHHKVYIRKRSLRDQNNSDLCILSWDIRATSSDLPVDQVAIVVEGIRTISSGQGYFTGRDDFDYYLLCVDPLAIDDIIQADDRVGLDISLRANWNFFGRHQFDLYIFKAETAQDIEDLVDYLRLQPRRASTPARSTAGRWRERYG